MSPAFLLVLVAHALTSLVPQAPEPLRAEAERVRREAWVMGTRARIVVEDPDGERASHLGEAALQELERIDALLSTWDPQSPLTRLNDAPAGAPVTVEPELAQLLGDAFEWSARTGGAFEPAVGALVDAWDLRGAGRSPTAPEIADALAGTGPRGVLLEGDRLTRRRDTAWIDSGGFGKGAALRSVARGVLSGHAGPTSRVLMDLGGQLLVSAPADAPWHVQVAHPSDRTRPVLTLAVSRGSVATTGTSERGLHVMDPREGRPVDAWGSVTVVHVDPFAADVLSTALYVMGADAGRAFAEQADLAALFLTEEAGHLSMAWTSHLTPWLADASANATIQRTTENERKRHEP